MGMSDLQATAAYLPQLVPAPPPPAMASSSSNCACGERHVRPSGPAPSSPPPQQSRFPSPPFSQPTSQGRSSPTCAAVDRPSSPPSACVRRARPGRARSVRRVRRYAACAARDDTRSAVRAGRWIRGLMAPSPPLPHSLPLAPQVQPMDLTKTRMQLMPKGTSPIAVARDVIAQGGIKGLYAGCVSGCVFAAAAVEEDEGCVTLAAWARDRESTGPGRYLTPLRQHPFRSAAAAVQHLSRFPPLPLHPLPSTPPLPISASRPPSCARPSTARRASASTASFRTA